MFKNKKFKRKETTVGETNKRPLKTIDENKSIKISRGAEPTAKEINLPDILSNEDDNIPASQEPTQRYLSQRSTISASLARTQSRNATYRPPNSYFELVLMKAGVKLDETDNFVLENDHIAFVATFREILRKCQSYPDNIGTIKIGLSEALSSKYVQKLLSGCTISGEDILYQSQDSMFVNFFMIDFLRDHVLDVLLDKIEEIAGKNAVTYLPNSNIALLPLLLAQLRYVVLTHGDVIYSRLQTVFEKCPGDWAKMDIIANAEFIIEARKHDEFVQLLLNSFAGSKDLFEPTIVQALTNLQLSSKMQGRLRAKVLAYIKENQCPYTNLPVLMRLLLQMVHNASDEIIVDLVDTLREILIWLTVSSKPATDEERSLIQLQIFESISQYLTCSKKFYTLWQKKISSLPSSQFRCIDFLMLLMLISIKEENYKYIANILRRRIKNDDIAIDILIECKTKHVAVVQLYTNTLMLILHDFLKEKSKAVTDFARASYGILFQICHSVQRSILRKLLELTYDRSKQNMTNLALELLRDLQRKNPLIVQNCGTLLMPLLDRLNDMSLSQTRMVMQILCSIAYPAPTLEDCPALQDQIDMIVKKQIINRSVSVKKQGIIGAVQLIDAIARVGSSSNADNADDLNDTFNTASDLPEGRGKVAANYFVRIHTSVMHSPELLALFYDELASVFGTTATDSHTNPDDKRNFHDKPFLIWLCELITYYFQTDFVAEHTPETILGIEMSYQKCINTIEDAGDTESELPPIAINIGELVLKPVANAGSSILVLAPLFNLLCVIQLKRHSGSLEQVNALLGCAIILPKFFDGPTADEHIFSEYDESVQRKILDIYFHCANWIRETVSSFSTQRVPLIRKKVLERMGDLLDIECKVRKLLRCAPPDYMPPICQFLKNASPIMPTKSGGRGRPAQHAKGNHSRTMRFNETESEDPLPMTGNVTLKGKKVAQSNATSFQCSYGPKEIYRPMGSEIMLILKEKLNLSYPLTKDDIGKCIGLREFHFLLGDMVSKLESITGVQKSHTDEALQYIAKPDYFMSDLAQFLTAISFNMNKISSEIHERLQSVNHNHGNSQLFSEEFNYLRACHGLCIRLTVAYFSWSEFNDATNTTTELLKVALVSMLEHTKSQQKLRMTSYISVLASELFKSSLALEESTVDLKTAVHLYHLSETLRRLAVCDKRDDGSHTESLNIRDLCKKLLCRRWFTYDGTMEKGAECNIHLNELVKGFLKDSDFKRINTIISTLLEECKQLGRKDSSLSSFPNFKKANFPILFRGLCEILINALHNRIATMDNGVTNNEDKLRMWEKSCRLLNMLLDIVQAINIPRNYQTFMKYSHLYLKSIIQHGLKVFEHCIRQFPERVSELLKDLQITTRFLHSLCCHSKAIKNTAIFSHIPFLRETVETLVFRVKALMVANNCGGVFCMANLKNKDLHGDIILSQPPPEESYNSEEDIPDDESIDETVIEDDSANSSATNSHSASSRSKSSSRSKCF